MGNHVIRDRIWVSQKLSRCSLQAALAYPWIFLVADDHGRFEYVPRQVWGLVFRSREDVSVSDVETWLSEYEREGLLIRYGHDSNGGHGFAEWYRFEGRPPSKRRPSIYPPPKGKRRYPTGTRPVPDRYPAGTEQVPDRKPTGTHSQSRRAEQESRAGAGEISAPHGASPAAAGGSPLSRVFDHWVEVMGHPLAKLTPKRARAVKARLREGYTEHQLFAAIDGCRGSPFNMGENDRHEVFDDLELICRSGEKVERFMAMAGNGQTRREVTPEQAGREYTERVLAQERAERERRGEA